MEMYTKIRMDWLERAFTFMEMYLMRSKFMQCAGASIQPKNRAGNGNAKISEYIEDVIKSGGIK